MTMNSKSGLRRQAFAYAAMAFFLFAGAPSEAGETLPVPKGQPILTVEGKISNTNVGKTAQFDREMLEAMGVVSISTTTPWFTGTTKFEGVPLEKVMEAVGAEGEEVETVALNDYKVTLPVADFKEFGVLLALKRDGEYMPVRDKGPLFIVYPYDSDPRLKNQKYYARSVWQLARMILK